MLFTLMLCCCASSITSVASWYLFFRKVEGDVCKGKDENALHQYDKNLKCKFIHCLPGHLLHNYECKVDQSGRTCNPDDEVDPMAIYKTDIDGFVYHREL